MLVSWGPPFLVEEGGVAQCCWWQVLARGRRPRTLVKMKLKWGGASKIVRNPIPLGSTRRLSLDSFKLLHVAR